MKTARTLKACTAALCLSLVAGSATGQAQDRADQLLSTALEARPAAKPEAAQAAPVINDGEAYHRADDSQQDPQELRTTQALNDEIASRNQLAENQERADHTAFEAEQARHEEDVAKATAARLAYEAALRDSETAQRQYDADRARWESDARACEAGDRARCAPAQSPGRGAR